MADGGLRISLPPLSANFLLLQPSHQWFSSVVGLPNEKREDEVGQDATAFLVPLLPPNDPVVFH